MTQYTQGEWKVNNNNDPFAVYAMNGKTIAVAYGTTNEERRANAKLIAALPRLLTELKAMVENFKDTPREVNCYTEAHINAAKAAIEAAI